MLTVLATGIPIAIVEAAHAYAIGCRPGSWRTLPRLVRRTDART